MTPLVIDTDIFIDYLRGLKEAKEFMAGFDTNMQSYFSSLTETELISGKDCENPDKRQVIIDMLSLHTKIPVDNLIALSAGDLRRKYSLGIVDSVIAATAGKMKARLVTRNLSDFKRIKEIEVVRPY